MQKNPFIQALMTYDTYTENGAVSHSTTGSNLVNYFAKAGTYRDRKKKIVFGDVSAMWNEAPLVTFQLLLYLRMITRSSKGFLESEKVQKGQGVRDEYRKAMLWVMQYEPKVFYDNLWLLPVVGSWKDLWHEEWLPEIDAQKVYELIARGLQDDFNKALIAKFLPKIRSKTKIYNKRHEQLNKFAFGLCTYMGWTAKEYRLFKASGTAHTFQRFMGEGLWEKLDFGRIPGRALFQMTTNRGKDGKRKTIFQRHNLEKRYLEWLETRPVLPFTGYIYELMKGVNKTLVERYTIDKQFDGLVELAKKDQGGMQGNVWCAIDTSGSMSAKVANTTAFDICLSLGVFFATINEGAFKDHLMMFDNKSSVKHISGTFSDKISQLQRATTAWGSTNFQSVIDEIVRVREANPNIPLKDYPSTLLVVSDMQFNPTGGNAKTNYEAAMDKLRAVGLPEMKIVWWWVTGRGDDFPSKMDDKGVTMIGGFDGSVITLLLNGETATKDAQTGEVRALNAYENMLKALDQEVLRQVTM